MRTAIGSTTVLILALLALTAAHADDAPDLEFNTVGGYAESVDLDASSRVRHTIDHGQQRTVETLSSSAAANPRMAIAASGNSWAVWWHTGTTGEVYYAFRDFATGTWSDETLLSDAAEDSRYPEIVYHDGKIWIAYEAESTSSTSIEVAGITDEAEPIGQSSSVATTLHEGDLDVLIHGEAGKLWVTWVDSATDVAWSEYDDTSESWSSPACESYENSTVATARDTIRAIVLGE